MKKKFSFLPLLLILVTSYQLFAQQYFINDSGVSNGQYCGTASGTLTIIGNNTTIVSVVRWEEGDLVMGNFVPTTNYTVNPTLTFSYNLVAPYEKSYRAIISVSGGTPVPTSSITLKVFSPPSPGVLTGNASYYMSGSGTLNYSGGSGSMHQWQKKTRLDAGWVNTTLTNNSYNVDITTEFRVVRSNGNCTDVATEPVKITVYELGVLTGPTSVLEGSRLTLGVAGNIIRWEYSTDGGITWTYVDIHGPYRHQYLFNTKLKAFIDLGPFGTAYTNTIDVSVTSYSQVNTIPVAGENYTKEQRIVTKGISDVNQVTNLSFTQKRENTTFMDGSGRVIQKNIKMGSSLNTVYKDLIQFATYDNQGRSSKRYLPYASSSSDGIYRTNSIAEQAAFYNNGPDDKIESNASPYAVNVYENSPIGRLVEKGGAGDDWQPGTGHTQHFSYSSNIANEVRRFNSDGSSSDFYPANALTKMELIDEDQLLKQTFSDSEGHVILSRVQYDQTGGNPLWLETYSIYSQSGLVKFIITPNGVNALKNNGWNFDLAFKTNFAHELVYDAIGRLIEKKVPGQAWVYYCYDRFDRLVLVQDGLLRTANKWIFIKYDGRKRPVKQGLYLNTTYTTRGQIQEQLIDPLYSLESDAYFELNSTTNLSFPFSDTEDLVKNTYDVYGTSGYSSQGLPDESAPGNALGLLTSTEKLILGSQTWLKMEYYYDAEGRIIQTRSNNHLQMLANDLTTIAYDFEGKMKYKKVHHDAGSGRTMDVLNSYDYDNLGRLEIVKQKNNTDAEIILAQYAYNTLGQLVEKNLHATALGQPFLQSIDYRYNIRGWLKSINNSQLNFNAENNNDTDDYFGMEFLYEKTESGLNSDSDQSYFNGSISALKWKSSSGTSNSGQEDQRSYRFDYDKAGRMTGSFSKMNDGTSWAKELNAINENLTYDPNGNILSLNRNQRNHQLAGLIASYSAQPIDELSYTYDPVRNDQLIKITDGTGNGSGFNNGESGSSNDYSYEPSGNGSLKADLNKGISDITYNDFGKPILISFTDTRKIEYVYDADGTKLTMKVYPTTASALPPKIMDYVNGFFYEDGALKFFSSQDGRVVKKDGSLEYQYAISDHQGNTRLMFSSRTPQPQVVLADMEDASNSGFQNYPSGGNRSVLSIQNHTSGGTYSQLLNGGNNSQVGVAKSYKVYPGDKLKIEAYAKYANPTTTTSNISAFASALLNAFMLPSPVVGEVATASSALNGWGGVVAVGEDGKSNSAPKVSVNIVVFDKNYNFLDAAYDQIDANAEQVGITPVVTHDFMSKEYTVKEEGYVFMYVANENETQVDAYFDDVSMTYTPTNIVQYNEYYPFGLQTSASWTRDGFDNAYLYNIPSEFDISTGWYETVFRNYDPSTGRFTGIDPKALSYSSFSPYSYGYNNPIMNNDPFGADPNYTGYFGEGGASNPYTTGMYTWGPGAPTNSQDFVDYWTNQLLYESYSRLGMGHIYQNQQETAQYMAYMARLSNDATFVTPSGDRVSARQVLAVDNPNQNPLWRKLAQDALSWIEKHHRFEAEFSVSYGAQATILVTPDGPVPAPYWRGSPFGINVNLGSWVVLKGKADTIEGARLVADATDNLFTQGFGISMMFGSFDYKRTVGTNTPTEDVVNFSLPNGILGLEYNFQKNEFSVGMMPKASWALIAGVEGGLKNVVVFGGN